LRGQVLVYPMLDHRTGGLEDPHQRNAAAHLVWTRENNEAGWRALQGAQALEDLQTGYFSASRATNLEGLPDAFIGVGALDLFFAENLAYATGLAAANVPLELHVYPSAPHGFDLLPSAAITMAAERDRILALTRFFSA
jgi:triacylglycerol lipase